MLESEPWQYSTTHNIDLLIQDARYAQPRKKDPTRCLRGVEVGLWGLRSPLVAASAYFEGITKICSIGKQHQI